mmetsp:Transcript_68404/g.222521  ORF Transcript_68404/g.222521 Transcript_68404/m.222521 type:complete len:316 (-) Transcript_68404:28-975(-)
METLNATRISFHTRVECRPQRRAKDHTINAARPTCSSDTNRSLATSDLSRRQRKFRTHGVEGQLRKQSISLGSKVHTVREVLSTDRADVREQQVVAGCLGPQASVDEPGHGAEAELVPWDGQCNGNGLSLMCDLPQLCHVAQDLLRRHMAEVVRAPKHQNEGGTDAIRAKVPELATQALNHVFGALSTDASVVNLVGLATRGPFVQECLELGGIGPAAEATGRQGVTEGENMHTTRNISAMRLLPSGFGDHLRLNNGLLSSIPADVGAPYTTSFLLVTASLRFPPLLLLGNRLLRQIQIGISVAHPSHAHHVCNC